MPAAAAAAKAYAADHHPDVGSLQYLAVAQKVLNSDKVLSQQSANVPNAVEDASCLMQADKNFMYIGTIPIDQFPKPWIQSHETLQRLTACTMLVMGSVSFQMCAFKI
jgi:hypothetical protein